MAARPKPHVRRPALPWRPADVRNLCGHTNKADALNVIEARRVLRQWDGDVARFAAELMQQKKVKDLLSAWTVARSHVDAPICRRCVNRLRVMPTWTNDPAGCLLVVIDKDPASVDMARDLWALAEVAAAHPDEFQRLLALYALQEREPVQWS